MQIVYAETIIASGDVGIRVLLELCLRILDGRQQSELPVLQFLFLSKRRYHELRKLW